MANNNLPPTLSARIISHNGRTLLVGSFGMATITKAFFLIWYLFLAILALTGMAFILQDPIFFLTFIALLMAPLVLLKLGTAFTKGQEDMIRENLKNILNAQDITYS